MAPDRFRMFLSVHMQDISVVHYLGVKPWMCTRACSITSSFVWSQAPALFHPTPFPRWSRLHVTSAALPKWCIVQYVVAAFWRNVLYKHRHLQRSPVYIAIYRRCFYSRVFPHKTIGWKSLPMFERLRILVVCHNMLPLCRQTALSTSFNTPHVLPLIFNKRQESSRRN